MQNDHSTISEPSFPVLQTLETDWLSDQYIWAVEAIRSDSGISSNVKDVWSERNDQAERRQQPPRHLNVDAKDFDQQGITGTPDYQS